MENRELAIALIAILAIVMAGKMGLVDLSGVPVVGTLFEKPGIKVAVVGHVSNELKAMLESEAFRLAGITYISNIPTNMVLGGSLNSYDEVILQGEPNCEIEQRRALSDYVKSGKKLIVIGTACTRMASDQNILGWDAGIGGLGDVMPVKHQGKPDDESVVAATLRIVERTHPVAGGISVYQNFTGSVADMRPVGSYKIIALVEPQSSGAGGGAAEIRYALIESTGLLSGKVLYYAFDPGLTSREMFLNALLYLKGAKG